jgi:transcriptional regulator with XRE-family HTH domain
MQKINVNVGERLHKRRKELRLTLKELAMQSGLTASFLSQVEHNKVNLSLNSLQLLAEALDVPVMYFMAEDRGNTGKTKLPDVEIPQKTRDPRLNYSPVVGRDKRSRLILPESGLEFELLVPSLGQKMVAFKGCLSPNTEHLASRLRESTDEIIYVLSGELAIELEDGQYIVRSDESIYFEGDKLIRMVNVSDQMTTWISVITPAVF